MRLPQKRRTKTQRRFEPSTKAKAKAGLDVRRLIQVLFSPTEVGRGPETGRSYSLRPRRRRPLAHNALTGSPWRGSPSLLSVSARLPGTSTPASLASRLAIDVGIAIGLELISDADEIRSQTASACLAPRAGA
jgi:hypothetical protein